jgi:hypothetical protein
MLAQASCWLWLQQQLTRLVGMGIGLRLGMGVGIRWTLAVQTASMVQQLSTLQRQGDRTPLRWSRRQQLG